MKDYYQILGVRKGASSAEIRRAYRILVQKLHPDVNPDPTAHELIKEVNEAYDVLGDESKKRDYDYRLENPFSTIVVPEEPPHRDPRYRRRAYTPPVVPKMTQLDLMNKYIHVIHKIFIASFALSVFLIIDLKLPNRVEQDQVISFSNERSGRYEKNFLHTYKGVQIKISSNAPFKVGQPIEIVRSRLLSILIEVRIPEEEISFSNLSTIFANFKFILWILTAFSAVGLFIKGDVSFRFNLGIMTFFVLMFALYLIIK